MEENQDQAREELKTLIREEPGIRATLLEVDENFNATFRELNALHDKRSELQRKLHEIGEAKQLLDEQAELEQEGEGDGQFTVPTEPGWYADRDGVHWLLTEDGWHWKTTGEDLDRSGNEPMSEFAPFKPIDPPEGDTGDQE